MNTAQWIAGVMFFYKKEEMNMAGVDTCEFIIFAATFLMRSMVIATKYAYFNEDDLSQLKTSNWDYLKSQKRMLLAGWCGSSRSTTLLEEALETACDMADVNLDVARVKLVSSCCTTATEVSARSLVGRICYKCFGESNNFMELRSFSFFMTVLCAVAPNVVRILTDHEFENVGYTQVSERVSKARELTANEERSKTNL